MGSLCFATKSLVVFFLRIQPARGGRTLRNIRCNDGLFCQHLSVIYAWEVKDADRHWPKRVKSLYPGLTRAIDSNDRFKQCMQWKTAANGSSLRCSCGPMTDKLTNSNAYGGSKGQAKAKHVANNREMRMMHTQKSNSSDRCKPELVFPRGAMIF